MRNFRMVMGLVLSLTVMFVFLFSVEGYALRKRNKTNPPGMTGGPGTDWANPPGPVGGPGASPYLDKSKAAKKAWWVSSKPYRLWKREELIERLQKLEEVKAEKLSEGDTEAVESLNKEMLALKETIARKI